MPNLMTPTEEFFRSHITFTSVPDITEISKPLRKVGLSYFTFDRTYKDGHHLRLTNAGQWIESYYRTELYKAAIFEKDPKTFSNGYVFWDWLSREPVYSAAAQHNIDHGMTIIEKHEHYSDFFHFGTTCDNFISQEKLINHVECLYHFITFFKQHMHDTILEAEKTRIHLPGPDNPKIQFTDLKPIPERTNIVEFLKNTKVTRIYLGEEFDNAYLTRREMDVLRMMKQGKTVSTMSDELSLSDRTLESHIKHIKEKFKCNTLFELGVRIGEINITNLYPFKIEEKEN